ncbi:MAG: histidinol dehydrogenase [Nanoarchaeota archaeon]
MIDIISIDDKKRIDKIKNRRAADLDKVISRVKPAIEQVKTFGDRAIIKFTKLYDGYDVTKNTIRISEREIKEAYKKVDNNVVKALKLAAANINDYAKAQMPKEWTKEFSKGVVAGQIIRPLSRVGCYVPAGQYPLPSTVLMTVIPAKVAGVREIIVCSPPRPKNYEILVAADIAGADKIFRIGGAQAIAAMAYGTDIVPKVEKIVGPGNVYVTAAKKLVYGDSGIDFLAGPSEVMIYSEKGNASLIAADMLAQAEHDRLASAIFITVNDKLAKEVKKELIKQADELSTKDIAKDSLKNYGAIIVADSVSDAFGLINDFAPEHLEIENESQLKYVMNAGAVFIGENSCESAGDYAVGPSHVLPTLGSARFTAGLSVYDFVKMISIQKLSKDGLESLKSTVVDIARAEGLEAHARAVERRFEDGA